MLNGMPRMKRPLKPPCWLPPTGSLNWVAILTPPFWRITQPISKSFRHALPELVNAAIGERHKTYPGLTKLGTDMSVPDHRLADVLALYETDLAATDLDHLTFGHIGANHLHVNILPRTPADYDAGKALYLHWAESIIAWSGSISAEHGIGKLKRELFRQMVGEEALVQMHALKQIFDPRDLLSPGNLWERTPS